jgi:hypothetical protein
LQRALIDLHCARCGTPLPPPATSGRPALWCSAACRSAQYRRRHSELIRKRDQARRRALVQPLCDRCTTPLPLGRDRRRRWCSDSCRLTAQRERTAATRTPKPAVKILPCNGVTCGICSEPLPLKPVGRPPKWCSTACRTKAYRARKQLNADRQTSNRGSASG